MLVSLICFYIIVYYLYNIVKQCFVNFIQLYNCFLLKLGDE